MRALLILSLLLPAFQEEKIEKGTTLCRALRPAADPALQALLKPYEFSERDFAWQLRETGERESTRSTG
jgi:hypothetical protein